MKGEYKALDVRGICEKKAETKFGATKEHQAVLRKRDGTKVGKVTVSKGRNPIKRKTLHDGIRNQLRLTKEQFERFLDCSMTPDEYLDILDQL
ncbi:hypothetical protein [Desulfohalovibrio reitneri]|uniref:hypothetical protein n=1 Tax=Desulfohalovibrio reitneri TaxID=1307759 RepID=UPI0004A6F8B8|nr:hypothetical protein [Desulfohalovibrio reitneri]